MNHQLQWRNQMRKLGADVEPARDLWPQIAARLAAAPPSRRRGGTWLALAATLLVAIGAGYLAVERAPPPAAATATRPAAARALPGAVAAPGGADAAAGVPRTALDWALPEDPALVASARRLDDASAQLQDALEQRPDAVFLVGLLNRTNAMRLRLMRKSPYPG